MKIGLLFQVIFFVLISACSLLADVVLPDTPAGRSAGAFFTALNSGQRQAIIDFVNSNFDAAALKESSAEERAAFFERLYQQSGGLDVMVISADSNDRFLVADTRSKNGGHWARIFISLTRNQPYRVVDVGAFGIPDPDSGKKKPWPETALSEGEARREIGRRVKAEADADRFSGVVMIADGARPIFARAYGMADKDFDVANSIDTKFNLASMNKMFTAIGIAQLVEAGKLSFDSRLIDVLPDYPNKEAAAKIHVRELLSHRSGLGDYFDDPRFRKERERFVHPKDYFQLFADRPLRFEPGTRFSYSNAGFVVLGAIIEKVSGQDYFDYIRAHIYKPAGMSNTDSYELTQVVPNRAIGYGRFEDDPLGIDPRRSNVAFLPFRGSPAGGGYSNAEDLLKFIQAFNSGKLVSAAMRAQMLEPKTKMVGSYRPGDYGFGFMLEEYSGKRVFGHGGGGEHSGIACDMKSFMNGRYTVIVLGNYDPPTANDLAYEITQLLARGAAK